MFRLFYILAVYLLIGTAQLTRVPRLVYDIQATEDEAVADLERSLESFKTGVDDLAMKLKEITWDVKAKSEPALDAFRNNLASSSGFLEDAIEMMTHINIPEQTCGILGVREYVMSMYDMGQECVTKMLNEVSYEMDNVMEGTLRLSERFTAVKDTIRNCKNVEIGNNEIVDCIVKETSNAEESLQSLNRMTSGARKIVAGYKAPMILSRCLAKGTTEILMEKVNRVTTCLSTKVPGFANVAQKINMAAQTVGNRITTMIDRLNDTITRYMKSLERKSVPIISKIDVLVNRLQRNVRKYLAQVQELIKQMWGKFTG